MKKVGALTIILILVTIYFGYLTFMEYRAQKIASDYYLENTATTEIPENIGDMTLEEFDNWLLEDKIERVRLDLQNDFYLDLSSTFYARYLLHFHLTIITLLMTILSWRIDWSKEIEKKL